MMEQTKNHLSRLLVRLLLCAAIAVLLCGQAFAMEGTGTEADPYVIKTAEDLTAVHNDLSGHYVLGNDLDLTGYDHTPIGNEAEGAFTGSFDGKEFTISNLTVKEATKYVGLFGYLEGSVKNVTLSAVTVDGSRYVGAVAGYISDSALLADCHVLSGKIICEEPLRNPYVGGISGYCCGVLEGKLSNGADVSILASVTSYAGGLAGYTTSTVNLDGYSNTGSISGGYYAGGAIGYVSSALTLAMCSNAGDISAGYEAGGLVGHNSAQAVLTACTNTGEVCANGNSEITAGGILGNSTAQTNLTNCLNTGKIITNYRGSYSKSDFYSGGMVGLASSTTTISDCSNTGDVFSICDNYGNYGRPHVSGMSSNYTGLTAGRCINRGNLSTGEKMGSVVNGGSFFHSIYTANGEAGIYACEGENEWFFSLSTDKLLFDINDYSAHEYHCANIKITPTIMNCTAKTLCELQDPAFYEDKNLAENWIIDPNKNSGLPFPEDMRTDLFDQSILFLTPGELAELNAEFAVDRWSISDDSILSCENGVVTALKVGAAGISAHAVNNEHRANCIVFVYEPRPEMSVMADSTMLNKGDTTQMSTDLYNDYPDDPQGLIWSSSDPSIATVDAFGNVRAVGGGEVTITGYAPLSDISASCTITVTAPITSLSVPSSVTINAGTPTKLAYTVSPDPFTGTLTWKSTDESIVTVEDGILTGHAPGMAIVTATSDTGLEKSCTVTVKQPSSGIRLSESEVTMEVGFTHELVATLTPENSTDTITWTSSNTSVATISNGVLTAKSAGQTLITATTTSGEKAYCTVTVKKAAVLPTSITLNKAVWSAKIGEKLQLTATVSPSSATNRTVTWSSSDPEVASVSSTGVVTALSAGETVITASTHNGYFAECEVKVAVTSSAVFTLGDGRVTYGETVDIPVYINRNPGIAAFTVTLDYDSSAMKPVAVTAGELLDVGTFETNLSDESRTALHMTWYDTEDLLEDGLAFTITMQVLDNASVGNYAVSLSYDDEDICNADKASVAFSVEASAISVVNYLVGDIYVDGKVGMKDIVLLCQYINDMADLTNDQILAADVYYDGAVDVKDLVELAQILMNQTPAAVQAFGLRALAADENTLSGKIKIEVSDPDYNGNMRITVSVSESADMAAFRFSLDALTEYLQINSIVQGTDLTEGTFQYQCNADGAPVVLWYDSVSRAIDGEIFVIHATIKDGTEFGDYTIDLNWDADDICNEAFSNITMTADTAAVDYAPNLLISDAEMTVEGKDISIQIGFTSNARSSYSAIAVLGFYENGRMVEAKIMPVEIHGDQAKIAVTVDHEFTQCKLFMLEGATTWMPIANATEVDH